MVISTGTSFLFSLYGNDCHSLTAAAWLVTSTAPITFTDFELRNALRFSDFCRRVLSIDPAVRNTGYAVLKGDPREPTVLAFNVISIPKKLAQSAALSANCTLLFHVIQKFNYTSSLR